MRRRCVVLFMVVLGLTFGSAGASSGATSDTLTYVSAGSGLLTSTPNALDAQAWGVGVRWSVARAQPTQISVGYSTCFPFRHYAPPCNDRGAIFDGVIPHHAFRITKMVDTCTTCTTFSDHRTVAAARLNVNVMLTELTDRQNPSTVRAHVKVTWTDCRDPNNDGYYYTRVTGTLTVGRTHLDSTAAIYPNLDALNANSDSSGTQPSVAELPLCSHGTPQ